MMLDLQQRPYDWREKTVRLESKGGQSFVGFEANRIAQRRVFEDDLGCVDQSEDADPMSPLPARDQLAEQTWTPTHLGLWPSPGTTEPNQPTAGTHGATHEIDYVVWRYEGHQIDVNYLNDEPDHLFGSEVVVTAFAKDEGLNLVATPDCTRQWVRDPYIWHAA